MKFNFFYFLELFGSLGVVGICCYRLYLVGSVYEYPNAWEQIFQICLVAVVIFELGIPGVEKSLKEIIK